jgi:hypothetical protein
MRLNAIAKRRGMPRFITKLRYREETMPIPLARSVCIAMSRNGSILPREEGMFSIGGTWAQTGILISNLAQRLPFGRERDDFVVDILKVASPLPFAAECLRWVRRATGATKQQQILSDEGEAAAVLAVANRIRECADAAPIYREFGQDAAGLFWIWSHARGSDAVAKYVRQWLDAGPEEVECFLDVRVGKAWGLESGLARRADFRREAYDEIAKLIDPAVILEKLKSRYGAQLENPQFHTGAGVPLASRIAQQFAYIHLAVLEDRRLASEQANAGQAIESADGQESPKSDG